MKNGKSTRNSAPQKGSALVESALRMDFGEDTRESRLQ